MADPLDIEVEAAIARLTISRVILHLIAPYGTFQSVPTRVLSAMREIMFAFYADTDQELKRREVAAAAEGERHGE